MSFSDKTKAEICRRHGEAEYTGYGLWSGKQVFESGFQTMTFPLTDAEFSSMLISHFPI